MNAFRFAGVCAWLAGCADGPAEETVIDELRVVSAVAEPPDVAPGDPWALTVGVADPLDEGFDLAVFDCLPDAPCSVHRPEVEDGRARTDHVAVAPVPQWVVACARGACDLDAVGEAELRDPAAWLSTLPLEGVSAAFRQVRVAIPPDEPSLANPVIEVEPDLARTASAGPEDGVPLRFVVPGARVAYGRATVGGFAKASWDVAADGAVTLEWLGPRRRDDGAGRIWVVFEGLDGTAAVFQGDVVR